MTEIIAVVLDTSPLSVQAQKPGHSADVDACHAWLNRMLHGGTAVYVPEIADYEVRRELIRAGKWASLRRLDQVKALNQYLPITTSDMLLAAELWARARNEGVATAAVHALDGDVILAAQALSLGLEPAQFIVATSNPKHLSRYVPADLWNSITPGAEPT